MSDKQKGEYHAKQSKDTTAETCVAALSALDERTEISDPETSDLSIILKDLHSLLSLIYNISTKLSLALKPSAPTYSASLPLLQDLAKHTSGTIHCINLLGVDQHGATLIKDTTDIVRSVIEALNALVHTFLDLAAQESPSTVTETVGEEYLVRTGTLHDLITKAQGPNGIPKDNHAAVRKHWESDKESLEDGLAEVARMIEEAEQDNTDEQATEDDLDDGWDELGLGPTSSMNKDELARANSVQYSAHILRLTTLLHKRVFMDVLSSIPSESVSNVMYDSLLQHSHSLLEASDELVATLYAPQDPASVRQEVVALMTVVGMLHTHLQAFFPVTNGLEMQLNQLSIQDSTSVPKPREKKKADKKWFDTCFEQISRLSTTFVSSSDR
ncbi:hypothetical protein ID866_5219 [Astraeus odoratus]|nr:hypothetical protein ID866_5219 [Astraeus odoratus]